MSPPDPITTAKNIVAVAGGVTKLAAASPDGRAVSDQLGKTALTVTKAINNALLPLAAVNFAFDKARAYFSEHFSSDLGDKVSGVPAEDIVEPKASIAGPALQGLAFAHEELDLKDMYLSLLASAMDKRRSSRAHPAFVEIIRQLDAGEARLLREFISRESATPIVELRLVHQPGQAWSPLLRHLADLVDLKDGTPKEAPEFPAIVDNWVRLGLVEVSYDQHLTNEAAYSWADTRPELARLRAERDTETAKVTYQKGVLVRTAFGEQFASAVGIIQHAPTAGPASEL